MQIFLQHLLAEDVAGPAWRDHKACLSLLGVTPHQVAERTVVRNFLEPVQALDLIDGLDEGGEPAVHREDVGVGDGADGKKVEEVSVQLPHSRAAELVLALHVEAVVLRDRPELVVPPYQQDLLRVLQLEQAEQRDGLHAVRAPVHVIAQEKIAGVRQLSPHLEYLQHVEELPMHIAHHRDRQGYSLHVFLLHQHVLELEAQDLDRLRIQDLASQRFLEQLINVETHSVPDLN